MNKLIKYWIESPPCTYRTQCFACRTDPRFQDKLAEHFEMPPEWPECPFRVTADHVKASDKLEQFKYWVESPLCAQRTQCLTCRTDPDFQKKIAAHFRVPPGWPLCPHEVTTEQAIEILKAKTPPNADPKSIALFNKRIYLCGTCEKWAGSKCSLYPRCAANFIHMVWRPYSICLAEHRRWYYSTIAGHPPELL